MDNATAAVRTDEKSEALHQDLQPQIEILSSIVDRITFASHQNDIAVIADLVVKNSDDRVYEDLELVFECEPALIGTKIWKIDRLAANAEIRIKDRSVPLAGAKLSELNERMRATVKLTLRHKDQVLSESTHSLIGLARNEWGGAAHMPELLAAFVMPNDPAISTILKQAGEVLRQAGEQPALDGYQSRSRQRVWQIASAIWAAISSRRLVYAEPPASFEREGQKIRTPSEILETGLATCLDTTVLFAAALEQAGLYPLVAFTNGHALCGVWLQQQQLPSLTTDECSDLRKYIALKELALFETTLVVNEPPLSFSKALAEGDRRISEENEHEFVYALDIKRARSQQITPLGAITKHENKADGSTNTGLIQALEAPPPLPAFDLGIGDSPAADTPETRLDHWKRKLLDLTKRNRLLNLKPSKTAIKLHCSEPAVLEDKLADGKKITVIPMTKMAGEKNERDNLLFIKRTGDDFTKKFIEEALDRDEIVSDISQSDLDAGMVELYRKAKTDMQEGGANTLYLALGVLKWKQSEHEERSYRAPLILAPVKLERKSAASPVKIVGHEDETVFNMTLLEMLRQDFDLRIPELEGELPRDHSGVDVPLIWEIVRKAVRDISGFEVVEETVLSTFSFAKYLMWKDLADRTEELKESHFVKHLIEMPRDPYDHSASFMRPEEIDEKTNPSELFMPLTADSSQVVAVHASAQGGDFILEGPPGTGKSQTIANIIAHNLALGRKVLFVSEKMEALKVVYDRLRKVGLSDFCLELHSNKANKRGVLDQLGQSWYNRASHTQTEWHEEAKRLTLMRDQLNGLVKALHTPGPTGISPRSAIGRAARRQDIHRYRLDWVGGLEADRAKDKAGLAHLRQAAKKLGQCYGELSEKDRLVFSDVEAVEWSNAWQSGLVQTLQGLIGAIQKLQKSSLAFSIETKLPDRKSRLSKIRSLEGLSKVLPLAAKNNFEFAFGPDYASVFDVYEKCLSLLARYKEDKKLLSCRYADEKISTAPFEQWKDEWKTLSSLPWPLSAVQGWVYTGITKKALGLSKRPDLNNDLSILIDLKNIRQEMDKLSASLPSGTLWRGLETDIEAAKEGLSGAKALRAMMAKMTTDIQELPEIHAAVKRLCIDGRELLQEGMPLIEAGKALESDLAGFEESFSAFIKEAQTQESTIDDLEPLLERAQGIVELQPRINAWCRWKAACNDISTSGLGSMITALESGLLSSPETEESFITAYCIWLAARLIDDSPELSKFSALEHEEKIEAFRDLDKKLSEMSVDYIRAVLSGDIPSPESKDRPAGYGVLSHELRKQKAHKPVRQLVAEMGNVLTALTPCLMMSPLSVAQFLSADNKLFDLVVFDEASQITVWDAIGAIARGKNVIVVGDPKQMPPTNFFDRAADSDGDDGNLDDLESILDEAMAASVKLHRLTGHYRSRHESLIAFSNHRYYFGDLVTYPCAETKESAVSLVNVDGLYQRGSGRTNPEEAKAVVKEVVRRLNDPELCEYSVGVVTLNSEQQRLIDNLLDQERRKDPSLERFFNDDVAEPVFVKNLETVQGDQRDVILLSIGYGPDAPGARTMSMNFGPLNRKGGERRLNVAITRATSEVVIFASFDPSMIDLTRTSSQAVRDLKHYMEFAQRGPAALGEAILEVMGENSYDSDFEMAIAEGLRKKGWVVHTQIGVSKFRIDLGVVHPDYPGKYLAGVECDGAAYHSSPSARDRDRVRHAILEDLGWKLIRIWSTDYWIDPIRTLELTHERLSKLLDDERIKVEEAKKKASSNIRDEEENIISLTSSEAIPDEVAAQIEDFEVEDEDSGLPLPEVYKVSGVISQSVIERLSARRFYEREYLPVIELLASKFIDDIGPITFIHVSTKIARLHGFQRTGSQIKKQVWAAIAQKRKHSKSPKGEVIFWPKDSEPQEVVDFRGLIVKGESRTWKDVPYPEQLGLAKAVLKSSGGDPVGAMASKIGLGRVKQATKDELEQLLAKAK